MLDSLRPRYPDASLWSLRRRRADPLGFLESLAQRGDFVPFALARRQAFLLNRPDYVSTVLVSHAPKFRKGAANQRAKHLLGNGLLTADGALHAGRRRLIQPAFARQRLEQCAASVVARSRALSERWTRDEIIDVGRSMGELTFGIVGEVIIGTPVDRWYEEVSRAATSATASVDPLLSLVAPVRGVRIAQARLRAVVQALLARSTGTGGAESLLSLLSAHDEGPDGREQQIDDVLTILLAGHDTIASGLTWTWWLLAEHPDVEEMMRAELSSVLDGRDASAPDLPRLPLTRAVFAESLRLYPPAWVLARHAVEPHRFDEGEVPAGALVLVSQYLLHRDERYFPQSRTFDPLRWLGERPAEVPRLAYFPFGAGARSCIGESFGWMEGILILATIAQRWSLRRLEPHTPPRMDARITLRPGQGFRLRASAM